MRRGRAEVGAELELAANRKPYLSDEELEGRKLDRTLFGAAVLLWPSSPSPCRCTGWPSPAARRARCSTSTRCSSTRGLDVYLNKAKCVNCHGPNGIGGAASYTLLNANGDYVASVQW